MWVEAVQGMQTCKCRLVQLVVGAVQMCFVCSEYFSEASALFWKWILTLQPVTVVV